VLDERAERKGSGLNLNLKLKRRRALGATCARIDHVARESARIIANVTARDLKPGTRNSELGTRILAHEMEIGVGAQTCCALVRSAERSRHRGHRARTRDHRVGHRDLVSENLDTLLPLITR